jgi:hypothetical protein
MAEDVLIPPVSLEAPTWGRTLRDVLETHGLAVAAVSLWLVRLAGVLPLLFVSDTWLSLVGGRTVARHGLPHSDTLTYWTLRTHWIDQQWAAHLVLYGVMRAAGPVGVAGLGAACVVAALALAGVAARRLGASPRSIVVGVALPLGVAPWMAEIRSQVLVLPLFVLAYALLAGDARTPGRRVLLVLPLLLVWANLHGSVALAALLAAGHGAFVVSRGRRAVGAALLLAPLTLLASPYALDLVGYYRLMLVAPPFGRVVEEWRPMTVGLGTLVFFVTAFAVVALLARSRRALPLFEQVALLVLLAAALDATRNAVWFALAVAVSLPRLLDAVRPPAPPAPAARRINLAMAPVAAAVGVLVWTAHVSGGLGDVTGSAADAAAIARAAGTHGIVLADDQHADWLLWQRPDLQGRVAYDVRFELFDTRQLARLVALRNGYAPLWKRCGGGFAVVTFSTVAERTVAQSGVLQPGARRIVDGAGLGAYAQRRPTAPCTL